MKRLLLAVVPLVAAVSLHAQTPANATASLVAAERAFAADASSRLVHDAFLAVLAPDGVLFRRTPVNGPESLAARPMAATLDLRWTPIYAETAADGLLGFTTGPSTVGQRGAPPAGTGFFVSVWRRSESGWRLALDCGIEAPIPAPIDSAAALLRTRTSERAFPDAGDLRAVEHSLISDYTAQFAARADDDVRVYRNGSAPATTRAGAVALVAADSLLKWAPSAVVVAGSGDLGYAYGVLGPDTGRPGGYLRIYRRSAGGQWLLAVDWHN